MGNLTFEKIEEAGRSIFEGITTEGIKIRLIIDELTKIVSVYPVLD